MIRRVKLGQELKQNKASAKIKQEKLVHKKVAHQCQTTLIPQCTASDKGFLGGMKSKIFFTSPYIICCGNLLELLYEAILKCFHNICLWSCRKEIFSSVVVELLFYVHGKHLR